MQYLHLDSHSYQNISFDIVGNLEYFSCDDVRMSLKKLGTSNIYILIKK